MNEEFHYQRGLSPAHSHSQGEEHMVGDRNGKRDRRTTHFHEKHEQSPHKERMVSSSHKKSRRGEQDRERLKSSIPQRITVPHS